MRRKSGTVRRMHQVAIVSLFSLATLGFIFGSIEENSIVKVELSYSSTGTENEHFCYLYQTAMWLPSFFCFIELCFDWSNLQYSWVWTLHTSKVKYFCLVPVVCRWFNRSAIADFVLASYSRSIMAYHFPDVCATYRYTDAIKYGDAKHGSLYFQYSSLWWTMVSTMIYSIGILCIFN
jgi:hypothetical protein